MSRYSLGKNVGTTDKSTSSRSTPIAGEDLTFDATVGEIGKIKQPRIQVQKWQGDTYISNPTPTLAPQLDLPDLSNVLAEPNRDFAGLADSLTAFNSELKNFGSVQTQYEGVMQKAARDDAAAIIKQTSIEGTAPQKLANLKAELDRIIKDPESEKDEIAYAKATKEKIENDSRLGPAIESAYREEAVLNNAASLSTAALTAKITTIKDGEEIEVPVHTLSPNDQRYINWADSYVFNKETQKLSSFEYKNIKGQLAQFLANDRSAQSKRFNAYKNKEYVANFNYETNKIGEDLRDGFITKEQAIHRLEALLERGRIGLVSETVRAELQENLVENVIVAYMKNNKSGNVNDLVDMFGSIMTGPVESRVISKEDKITITTQEQADRLGFGEIGDVVTDIYAVRNDKQLWIKQFPAGYLEARISDANTKLSLNDEASQKVIDGVEETNSIATFKKEVFPLLAGDVSNIPVALVRLGELRKEAIEAADGNAAKIDAINKAYDKRENTLYGIFSVDYNQDVDDLNSAAQLAMRDPSKIALFNRKLNIFTEKWSGYNKADKYLEAKANKYQTLYSKLQTSQLKPIQGVLSSAKKYYVNTIGREEKGKYNTLDEEAQWELIESNIIDDYVSGIDLDWSEKELDTYNKKFIEQFTGANKKLFIQKYMPDIFQKEEQEKTIIKPTYEGTVTEGLNIWEQQALNTGELNKKGLLNNNGRDRIRILYESDTPLLSVDSLDSVIKQLKSKGTIDRRLKVIVNNLPPDAQGKLGTFLLHEYKKHGIIPNEAQEKEILSLNGRKMAKEENIDNTSGEVFTASTFTSSFFQPSVLVASTDLTGILAPPPPVIAKSNPDPLTKPDTLSNLIGEMKGAYQFRGASNPNYREGDYRSNKKGNWFFDFKPELIDGAVARIQTLTEQDLNAMTLGALLEAGTTDLEKFEVGANLLVRSAAAGNIPIAEILAAPNQYEAIFNPMGRVKGLKPYTVAELNATPNFVKLGLLLQVSPKKARTLYYFHRNQFASQIKSEG